MKRYLGLVIVLAVIAVWRPDAQGYEEYVLGGDEHPWQESWQQSGEVVMIDTSRVLQPLEFDPSWNIAPPSWASRASRS